MDPDLRRGEVNTEAPTATKNSFFVLLFLASHFGWRLAAGDVEAAFLNGVEATRGLFFEAPTRGLPGVPAGCLIEIIKGVFGLASSPRLWWDKLSKELKELKIEVNGEILRLHHHDYDPCMFVLRANDGDPSVRGMLITHVDDLLVAAPDDEMAQLQQGLSKIFPISDWETDEFEYTGTTIKQTADTIEVHQESYVNSRLETVDFPKEYVNEDSADEVTRQDNMSTIGALSWLASQTRPDLQAGVSLAQRKQKHPTYQDIKDTNRVVKLAQTAKSEPLKFTKLAQDPSQLVMLVYHDAAWANATVDMEVEGEDAYVETYGQGIYSQLGHVMIMTTKEVLEGKATAGNIVGWKSHACRRVCRSTFAAETMSALEGWEDALAFRSHLAGVLFPSMHLTAEKISRNTFPVVSLTDCKSLYDNIYRVGGPRAPNEKRLIVDLAALRHMVSEEESHWGNKLPGGKALRWLPTTSQLADILTKVLTDVIGWWSRIRALELPFSVQAQQYS